MRVENSIGMDKNSKNILVVEDSIDLRELFVRALKRDGLNIVTTGNGSEALRKINEGFESDVILFDLNMPEMGGEEFLVHVRNNPKFSQTKVVVVSGVENLAEKASKIGADGFIKKPVSLSDLCGEVHRQLSSAAPI